jgi:hypothetical protein
MLILVRFGTPVRNRRSISSIQTSRSRQLQPRKPETSSTRVELITISKSGICERRLSRIPCSDIPIPLLRWSCRPIRRHYSRTRMIPQSAHGMFDPLLQPTGSSRPTMAPRRGWRRICSGLAGARMARRLRRDLGMGRWSPGNRERARCFPNSRATRVRSTTLALLRARNQSVRGPFSSVFSCHTLRHDPYQRLS